MKDNFDPKKQIMAGDLDRIDRHLTILSDRLDKITDGNDKQTQLLNDRENTMMEVEEDVKLILMILKGNELDKSDGGIIGGYREMKARIDKLEKFRDKIVYVIAGVSATASTLITILAFLLKMKK